jgi:hypothetical protein
MRSLLVAFSSLFVVSGIAAAQQPHPMPKWRAPGQQGLLRNRAQGMCLDVEGWATKGNGNVHLWNCNGDPDQSWSFAQTGELLNAVGGVCLDAAGYDGHRGANVGIYRCEGQDDQRWNLVPRGPGVFELRNRKQGMCLDVAGSAGARGDNVLLWNCDGGADQLWSFEPINGGPQRREIVIEQPPPPPPPQEGPRAIGPEHFQALLQAIAAEGFSEGKINVIQDAARMRWFRVAQVKEVLDQLAFSADKLNGLELLAPRLVDPQNSFEIFGAFTFSADKEKAREILHRNGF